MGRFITLATPAVCVHCGKLIRRGRVAYWHMAEFLCYPCARKSMGEPRMSPEEQQLMLDLDQERGRQ